MIDETQIAGDITGAIYREAYLKKLQYLIEKESDTPLPVILDQFFSAPHLATGNARQVAETLWRELDEIRQPVLLLEEWLETHENDLFDRLMYSKTRDETEDIEPVSDDSFIEELEGLSLGEFFELL